MNNPTTINYYNNIKTRVQFPMEEYTHNLSERQYLLHKLFMKDKNKDAEHRIRLKDKTVNK